MLCAALLLVVWAVGCASINHLREAQDAFNQAAAAENALRFESTSPVDGYASATATARSSARTGYTSALLSLEKLDAEDQRRLRLRPLPGVREHLP